MTCQKLYKTHKYLYKHQVPLEMRHSLEMNQLEALEMLAVPLQREADSFEMLMIKPIRRYAVRMIQEMLNASQSKMAQQLREGSPTLREEFEREMLGDIIRMNGHGLRKIFEEHDKHDHFWKIEELIDTGREHVRNSLSGNRKTIMGTDAEMEGSIVRRYEDTYLAERRGKRRDSHFQTLFRKEDWIVRPMELHDISAVERLYGKFQFTAEDLVNGAFEHTSNAVLGDGKHDDDTKQSRFLYPFKDEERPYLEELLPRSKRMKELKSVDLRRQLETLEAWVVVSPLDEREVYSASIVSLSPLVPKNDPYFYGRMQEYIADAEAGGAMHYVGGDKKALKNFYAKSILQEPSEHLALVVAEVPGMIDPAHACAMRNTDINPSEPYFTYTMREIIVTMNGNLLELTEGCGKNPDFPKWGKKWGFKRANMWRGSKNPPREFQIPVENRIVTISGQPLWDEYKTTARRAQKQAQHELTKFPAERIRQAE